MDAGLAAEGVSLLAEDESPDWAKLNIPPIDYNDIYYYAAKTAEAPKSLDEVIQNYCGHMKSWAFR